MKNQQVWKVHTILTAISDQWQNLRSKYSLISLIFCASSFIFSLFFICKVSQWFDHNINNKEIGQSVINSALIIIIQHLIFVLVIFIYITLGI